MMDLEVHAGRPSDLSLIWLVQARKPNIISPSNANKRMGKNLLLSN